MIINILIALGVIFIAVLGIGTIFIIAIFLSAKKCPTVNGDPEKDAGREPMIKCPMCMGRGGSFGSGKDYQRPAPKFKVCSYCSGSGEITKSRLLQKVRSK